MRLRLLWFFIVVLLLHTLQAQQTLPPYHWANPYIEYLRVRGYLSTVDRSQRPYDRLQIARALLKVDSLNQADRSVYKVLYTEFKPEINYLASLKDERWSRLLKNVQRFLTGERLSESDKIPIDGGVFVLGQWDHSTNYLNYQLHPYLGLRWNDHFYVYHQFKIFNHAGPDYIGKKFSGAYAYSEQAYLTYSNDWLQAKIGRDWLQIGSGHKGQLLFSDNSQPFDQYKFDLSVYNFRFSFWGIRLNRRTIKDASLRRYANNANRYINAHRLSYNWKNRYRVGVSEVVVYGGPNTLWEAAYLNPLMFYYAYNVNTRGLAANLLYNVDWDLLFPDMEVYGEFLLDDFQIEKKVPSDLEPNELGLQAGLKWADPLGFKETSLLAEYTQIRNRTYNAPINDWEKYLHRNRVIGYYLGNNLEDGYLEITRWFGARLRASLFTEYLLQGEGSVAGPFNTDYNNYTVQEGYNEPFPYGIVQRELNLGLYLFYRPGRFINFEGRLSHTRFCNYEHQRGLDHQEWRGMIGVWFEIGKKE